MRMVQPRRSASDSRNNNFTFVRTFQHFSALARRNSAIRADMSTKIELRELSQKQVADVFGVDVRTIRR